MKNNNLPVLSITNIKWNQTNKGKKRLPGEIELQWGSKQWDYNQVLNWLSSYYNTSIDSLNIKQSENKDSGSG